jgi:hypothetical protein
MKKIFKIISITNVFLLVISLLIGHFSEYIRGQNPLYVNLKITAYVLIILAVLGSLVNTLFLVLDDKTILRKHVIWTFLSLLPFLYVFSLIIISWLAVEFQLS